MRAKSSMGDFQDWVFEKIFGECGFLTSDYCDISMCARCFPKMFQLRDAQEDNNNGAESRRNRTRQQRYSETSDSNQVFQKTVFCGVVHDARSGARHAVMVLRVVHAAFGGNARLARETRMNQSPKRYDIVRRMTDNQRSRINVQR